MKLTITTFATEQPVNQLTITTDTARLRALYTVSVLKKMPLEVPLTTISLVLQGLLGLVHC